MLNYPVPIILLYPVHPYRQGLGLKQAACKEKIKTLETSKEYLEKNVKESENNLRELITQKKGAA